MTHDTNFIDYGRTRIAYHLTRSSRRKHLGITVQNDKVSVAAPSDLCTLNIQKHLKNKAAWILAKIDLSRKVPPHYPRELISGETLEYLGRQYQLRVSKYRNRPQSIKLIGGHFRLELGSQGDSGQNLLKNWYQDHLTKKLQNLVRHYAGILNLSTPPIQIRDLGQRWGSCGKNGTLYFHWQLARLSMTKISFVCAHEVAHLRVPNHNAQFQSLLARLVPESSDLAAITSL